MHSALTIQALRSVERSMKMTNSIFVKLIPKHCERSVVN